MVISLDPGNKQNSDQTDSLKRKMMRADLRDPQSSVEMLRV